MIYDNLIKFKIKINNKDFFKINKLLAITKICKTIEKYFNKYRI